MLFTYERGGNCGRVTEVLSIELSGKFFATNFQMRFQVKRSTRKHGFCDRPSDRIFPRKIARGDDRRLARGDRYPWVVRSYDNISIYLFHVSSKRKDAGKLRRILFSCGFYASVNRRRGCEERINQKNQNKYFQGNELKNICIRRFTYMITF